MGFVALPLHATACDGYQLVVVDLGYSASRKSCGVAVSSSDPSKETFGRTVNVVREHIGAFRRNPGCKPLLVLEAPLSRFHSANGNPGVRGEFENGRGWYCGAGAVTALAAQRFLCALTDMASGGDMWVAEAFLSNKVNRTSHADDAARILRQFWDVSPVPLQSACEPLLSSIAGVPPVRVF